MLGSLYVIAPDNDFLLPRLIYPGKGTPAPFVVAWDGKGHYQTVIFDGDVDGVSEDAFAELPPEMAYDPVGDAYLLDGGSEPPLGVNEGSAKRGVDNGHRTNAALFHDIPLPHQGSIPRPVREFTPK